MIFVTVGTVHYPFVRMQDLVYRVAKFFKNEEIIYQHGNVRANTTISNVVHYDYLPFYKIDRFMKTARIIISHGGPATIYQVLNHNKIPFVYPRNSFYHEHVNNHQILFCKYMRVKKNIILVSKKTSYKSFMQKPTLKNKLRDKPTQIITFLDKYLSDLNSKIVY